MIGLNVTDGQDAKARICLCRMEDAAVPHPLGQAPIS